MIKRSEKVSQYLLPIKIEKQESGYLAKCTIWPDCYAQGNSIDEAVLEITAVAQSLIELYKEKELVIPLKLNKEKTDSKDILTLPIISAV